MAAQKKKIVIISGPSGVGKTKLLRAFRVFHPEISAQYEPLVYYVSRAAREDERHGIDRFFITRNEIEKLRSNSSYIVAQARNDFHAICLDSLLEILKEKNVIYEGSPFLAIELLNHPSLSEFEKISVFISPISNAEIKMFKNPGSKISLKEAITKIISLKLLKRALKQKTVLSIEDYEDIIARAASAYEEMKFAIKFDHVIPNHDGEESENWDCFHYPIGDARKTLLAFIEILNGRDTELAEKWRESLF